MSYQYDTFPCALGQLAGESPAHEQVHSRTSASERAAHQPDEFDLLVALLIELRRADKAGDVERFALLASTMSQELRLLTVGYPPTPALLTRNNGCIAPFDRGVAETLTAAAVRWLV